MLTTENREKIVKVAESWYGTPFRGHSCLKGCGVDCGQLIRAVFIEAGLIPDEAVIPNDYSLQIWQHKDDTTYLDIVLRYMRDIPESEVLPGDVVLYKWGRGYAHGAIIKSWPTHIIHALDPKGVCAGHGKGGRIGRLEKIFFTLKEAYTV